MAEHLRRYASTPFQLGEVRVDPARLLVADPHGSWHLEPRVMDVLAALAAQAPAPVSRDALIDAVWGDAVVGDGALSRCISILRKRLGDDRGRPRYIETLSKRGYRLVAPVGFVPAAKPVDASSASAARAPAPAIPIAVLPFVNLGADAADECLADGLTELLIAQLAGIASLRVIARTSSMAYKQSRARVRDIAAELGVDYVVEGSVRHEAGRIQVVTQLIEARSEIHAWAHTCTRELSEALTLLGEIARSLARALSARLLPAEAARLSRHVEVDAVALQHYLRGRFFWAQRGTEGLRKAAEAFAACTREAPDFAPAHCGLADCRIVGALYGVEAPRHAAAAAREHHARALALDPGSAEVQTAHGAIRLFFDWDFDGAEQAFACALAGNPSYTTARLAYGDLLMMRGEAERGLAQIREAMRLSPFDLGLAMNLGDFLIFARRLPEAVRQFEQTLEMDPHFVPARLRLAEALALDGQLAAARRHAARAQREAPGQPRVQVTAALVHAAGGGVDRARRELVALAALRESRHVCAWDIARGHAALADADAAFGWLDTAIRERAPMALFAGVHPALDALRADPRMLALLGRIGLRQRA